ncbi:MAG: hypothetical protein H6668_17095 [Ardenticatenaceae bacterium]|nr:hypothetical protein [Ardenticatenaceae bacterium]
MELQAITGQLYVVNGQAQTAVSVPGLLATSAPKKANRSRARDFLFVHLTLTGKVEETAVLTLDLLATINESYFQSSGSVTAGLRRALIEANEKLLRHNLSQSGPSREGAITCAVLRNNELYMLQAGEALALLGRQFGVERLPARLPERITPVGRTAGLDIRYFHQQIDLGDMLLLADPRIAHLPSDQLASALVDVDVETGLEALRERVGNDSARLLLIEFSDEAVAVAPVQPSAAPVPDDLPTMPNQRPEILAKRPLRAQQTATDNSEPTLRIPRPKLPDIDVEHSARQATADAAIGLSRFTRWLADLLSRLRPGTAAPADPDEPGLLTATLLAILIPIILGIIVTGVYLQRSEINEFARLKRDMSANLVLAEEAGDNVNAAREYYNLMLGIAAEAETIRPGDADVNRMRQEAFVALDRIDGVTRLVAEPFFTYDEGVRVTAVSLREGFSGGIDVLDSGNGQVLYHATDESYTTLSSDTPEQIVFRGQAVGTHVVGTIIDLLWRPRGLNVSRDGVAMLDSSGTLLTYFPNFSDTRAVPLGLASEWRTPRTATTFAERLYVLDPGAGQIWKYFPEGDGFNVNDNDRAISFVDDPDLANAVDFDIYSENGSLVVVYKDGRLRYYDTRTGRVQWDEANLLQEGGLTTPLIAPNHVKIIGRGLNASVFVADPGSSRIVQISQGGTILAQYRASDGTGFDPMAQMDDFAVAPTPLRIFMTNGNILYLATQE